MDRCCSVFVVVEAHLDHTLEKPIHSTGVKRSLGHFSDLGHGDLTFNLSAHLAQ